MNKDSDITKEEVKPPNDFEISVLQRKGYLVFGSAICSGGFAAVFKCKYKEQIIAVKIIDCELNSESYMLKFLPRELKMLKTLKHKYIAQVFDIFTIANRVFVFMELAECDSIDILKDGPIAEPKCKILYKQICTGLQYMHSKGIAHRDLKCENILIFKKQTIAKLTDFGFARRCVNSETGQRMLSETHCGSSAYVAPELLMEAPIDAFKADCWSIGVVLFVLVNNKLPFNDKRPERMLRKQKTRQFTFNVELSPECQDLIKKQLNPDIPNRYNIDQILAHKWLISVKI